MHGILYNWEYDKEMEFQILLFLIVIFFFFLIIYEF